MQFILISDRKDGHVFYQVNQLVSIKQVGIKLWQVTFSDMKTYNVQGGDYMHQFEFIQNSTKQIYELKVEQ